MDTQEDTKKEYRWRSRTDHHRNDPSGALYGLGFIGACIYYISSATTFWLGVLGFLKSLVWPAFLVFDLLKFLNP